MGKEAALALHQRGHIVYGAARRRQKMQELEDAGAHALEMDITQESQRQRVVDHIIAGHGRIDVLINNAGYAVYGAVEDTAVDHARDQFEVNLFGLARLTQLVLPHMRLRKKGRIINISSMGGKIYTPLGAWYHASKHALEGWSDCLRLELKAHNITVVIIQPGIIRTAFTEVMAGPMLERSGEGAYGDLTRAVARSSKELYREGEASSPAVVARALVKVVEKRKPKTRYAVGKMARLMISLRLYLGDRFFDRAVMSQL